MATAKAAANAPLCLIPSESMPLPLAAPRATNIDTMQVNQWSKAASGKLEANHLKPSAEIMLVRTRPTAESIHDSNGVRSMTAKRKASSTSHARRLFLICHEIVDIYDVQLNRPYYEPDGIYTCPFLW